MRKDAGRPNGACRKAPSMRKCQSSAFVFWMGVSGRELPRCGSSSRNLILGARIVDKDRCSEHVGIHIVRRTARQCAVREFTCHSAAHGMAVVDVVPMQALGVMLLGVPCWA